MRKILKTALAAAMITACAGASAGQNFQQAKRELPGIYKEIRSDTGEAKTIYCGCDIEFFGKNKWKPDLESCGYEVRKQRQRAERIEAEHVVPAYNFGRQLKCWKDGGRKNCSKDRQFNVMEGDLHNLYPSIGEVNGDRSNFRFTDWNGKSDHYGKCDMVIDFKGKRAQPPKEARGKIARAYLYMAERYKMSLSAQDRRLYDAWNRQYAPTAEECIRNAKIAEIQGNDNPYITEKCKKMRF